MSDLDDRDVAESPEDLPPVQPPSAGFILQLFVVPGLIVLAVVAVWGLFGKMASGEQDWRSLVVELQHPNPHRRWRGALGLAQILKADQGLGSSGERLSRNDEVATSLSGLLLAELRRGGQTDEDLKYQAFLARTLGLFELPERVLPALEESIAPQYDREVRKNGLGAIAVIAGRESERGQPLTRSELAEKVVDVSTDSDPLIRQLSAFTLGLLADPASKRRLAAMLDDADPNTRANAAVGLARQHDVRGVGVLTGILKSAAGGVPEKSAQFEQFLLLKNCLTGISRLTGEFSPAQRRDLIALIQPIASSYAEPQIRLSAIDVLKTLQESP